MKLTIEHSNTKRSIDGSFNLCASRLDIACLIEQLQHRMADESWSFGWVTIYPASLKPMANTSPKAWDE